MNLNQKKCKKNNDYILELCWHVVMVAVQLKCELKNQFSKHSILDAILLLGN